MGELKQALRLANGLAAGAVIELAALRLLLAVIVVERAKEGTDERGDVRGQHPQR